MSGSKINKKEILGKRIRMQYFDWMALLFAIPPIYYFFQGFEKPVYFELALILALIASPLYLLAILNKFCIGEIICILAEDRLYYFDALVENREKKERTNGYIYYSNIKNIELAPGELKLLFFKLSVIVVHSDGFKLTIGGNRKRSLIRQIKKKQKEMSGNVIATDYVEFTPEPVRIGLFKELWDDYEQGKMRAEFERICQVVMLTDKYNINTIDISVIKNGCDMQFNVDEESIYMYANGETDFECDKTVMLTDIYNVENFYNIISEFIEENSKR